MGITDWRSGPALVALASQLLFAAAARADGNGEITLSQAAQRGDLALLRSRLKEGADPNLRNESGRTALMDAVAAGQLGAARLLLSKGADVNAHSGSGRTALIEAAAHGQLEAVRLLVRAGASLDDEERGWGTALETAERDGRDDIARVLRAVGARSSGHSPGDTVCVRPWGGDGYCGKVTAVRGTEVRLRVTEIVGCRHGCPAKGECSAGRQVGAANGMAIGDEVATPSWCLTHTGVKP